MEEHVSCHFRLDLTEPTRNINTVITCTKCGEKNSDDTLICSRCKNKLQSLHRSTAQGQQQPRPLETFRHEGVPTDAWRSIMRMVEAWAYVLVLAGVAAACAYTKTWWPMYPAVGLLGLLIWYRQV
ncbi:zinc ribbon domain-containing protein [uncultured Pseudodesulfovibrio sp.]|uniref:zinc ribbon domain-containing protein n=1 Tax=uncultured Pseudodesulfovibrio sp. TaxID=2035858 RepID=UPI0029C9A2F9|nr:zinc ribbon domain-containing protein [uncultured Pseudodesulfovibrio sp.]